MGQMVLGCLADLVTEMEGVGWAVETGCEEL